MQEAAKLKADWAHIQEYVTKDPFAAVKEGFGIDLEALAEQRLAEKYKFQMLPEHEQQKVQLEKERDALRAQLAERENAEKTRGAARARRSGRDRGPEAEFGEALQKAWPPDDERDPGTSWRRSPTSRARPRDRTHPRSRWRPR
jgi:hypothetical protein